MEKTSLSHDDWDRIDHVCITFELALTKGSRPDARKFARLVESHLRSLLVSELLRLEMDLARRRGGDIDLDAYLLRYPEFHDSVHSAYDWLNDSSNKSRAEVGNGEAAKPSPDAVSVQDHHWNYLRKGDVLGRFTIEADLGRSAFGTVYRAFDPRLEREVALKVPRYWIAGGEPEARFVREARAAARLRHSNICPIYELDWLDDSLYLVMPLLDGQSLKDRIEQAKGALPFDPLVLIQQVAIALAHAHRAGLIHRDLKPGNIMVNDQGIPTVMDFGLALLIDGERLTQTGDILGTPTYLSPEQARGDSAKVGPSTDIYSLGAILFELLSWNGKRAESRRSRRKCASNPNPLSLLDVRPDLVNLHRICQRAMATRPEERFQSMDEFAEAIGQSLIEESARPSHASRFKVLQSVDLRDHAIGTVTLEKGCAVLVQFRYPCELGRPTAISLEMKTHRVEVLSVAKSENEAQDTAGTESRVVARQWAYVQVLARAVTKGSDLMSVRVKFPSNFTCQRSFELMVC